LRSLRLCDLCVQHFEAMTLSMCQLYWVRGSADRADSAILSADELARASAFRRAADAAAFIARRAALRWILAGRLGVAPADVRLTTNAHGKPLLADGTVHFSLSHRRGVSIIALADQPVGVDLEFADSQVEIDSIGARFFAPDEREALRPLPEDARRSLFFRLWTRKEAFVKALGVGIAGSFTEFTALDDAVEWDNARWTLESRRVEGGWVSVCVQESRQRRT
jgi:4'-phosphopantetheinyl transferase